jgi:predicted Zn finger-like uncharacterized protein
MPITLNCPKCHKPFRVRDESIGGRVRCPSCGSVLQVPSALAPASHFGDDPRPEGGSLAGTKPMAEDYPIGASRMGSLDEAVRGGAGAVDLNPPAGAPMPGPPSIQAAVPEAPRPAPARPSAPQPPAPQRAVTARQPIRLPGGNDPGWAGVAGGLGMIRTALWLCALVFVGVIGHGAWAVFDPDGAMKGGPGFLGKEGWPRWKEVLVAYTAGPLVPAALLLLVGRLRCGRAPAESHARGLALGAAFFTLLGLVAAAAFVASVFFGLGDKVTLPPLLTDTREVWLFGQSGRLSVLELTALLAFVPSAVLADVLTLLFVGQIGWPVGRPRLQKAAASVFLYVVVFPAAVLIGHQYYPALSAAQTSYAQTGTPLGGGDNTDLAQRVIIWTVILVAGSLLFFLRYGAVAGGARRAVRRFLAGEA